MPTSNLAARLTLTFALLLAVAGCATLNRDECLSADWQTIGYEDGVRGYSTARVGDHRQACAEYAVAPDLNAYQAGHAQGVTRYCTAVNGYEAGRGGNAYNGVCPAELENDFLNGYEAGKRVYQLSSQLRSLDDEFQRNEKELDHTQQQIAAKEALLFNDKAAAEQRRRIYEEISVLREKQGQLRQKNLDLSRRRAETDVRLRRLEDEDSY